uniref:ADAM_CR_2 domain-containing protein n=1 Tax=Mesocestoides corti TaxID=53468 RepID=A0A5K3FXL5_MESCO
WRRIRAQIYLTTGPQPILCFSAFQWHTRKISSQPKKDTTEVQYIMSGVASVGDSDERRLTCGSTRANCLVNYSLGPPFCQMWGAQCEEPSQKLRSASLLRGRQCGDGSGLRHIGPRWPQPILCLSAFPWHARKISSQPEKDTSEVQHMMSGMASVSDSDGWRLTCGSSSGLVSKACAVAKVFFPLGLGYSTGTTSEGADITNHASLSQ